MKSQCGVTRPDKIINNIESGWISGDGRTLTPKQCAELWTWIEEIENELIFRREWNTEAWGQLVPWEHGASDDPEKYQDDEGGWIEVKK